jgi:hypothetical protein
LKDLLQVNFSGLASIVLYNPELFVKYKKTLLPFSMGSRVFAFAV